jgi:sugar transferase (PEP-CTERM/EpsH1 system associated)
LAYAAEDAVSPETESVLRNLCKESVGIPLGRWLRWFHGLCSFLCGRTVTEGMFQSEQLHRIVAKWSKIVGFDAVFVFCSSVVQYLNPPELHGVQKLVDLVDVDSQKWFDYAAECKGPRRWLYQTEGNRLRKLEQSIAHNVDAITLVSVAETELFRSFCSHGTVIAIPNGVDLEYFQPRQEVVAATSPSCVFVGALDYRANIDGVRWFCTEVWPEVLRRCPTATFTMVGSRPTALVHRLAELPGIRLANDVPDVRPYLAKATFVVVPLRIARGIQNKVLEALAMGKAVVASPQALEGLAVEPDVHVCRATTAEEWIHSLDHLFGDSATRERLGHDGRAFVETHYRWGQQLHTLGMLLGLHAESGDNP